MISTRTSQTDKIDLMQTLMNQLSLARMTKYLWHLAIALTLLAPLTLVDLSYAAGQVFYDGFEDGTTNKWGQVDGFRNGCVVVSSALDGGSTPHDGTKMLRCNWNGVVAWNDPASVESLILRTWSYSTEFFLRFWIRTDSDFGGLSGPKFYRIGEDSSGTSNSFMALHVGGGQQGSFFGDNGRQIGTTFWGNGSDAADGKWHKVEVYIKQHSSSGIIRFWEDGSKLWEVVGANTLPGKSWTPFYISSNWSGAAGCCDHDASNHLYWDDFEIYSDTGSGASGSMSDATISSGSGDQTVPNTPQGVQVIVTP